MMKIETLAAAWLAKEDIGVDKYAYIRSGSNPDRRVIMAAMAMETWLEDALIDARLIMASEERNALITAFLAS